MPEDVAITYKGNLLSVKGKLGEGSLEIHPDVETVSYTHLTLPTKA